MRLLSARIKNFRSFKKEQTFSFPQEPGLYFMRGLNEVEPRLGGNGVGKTTLWEALLWCVFGKTSRGLKAGDVCSWDVEGGTEVAFDFAFDDQPYIVWTMTRTWKPNTWTLSHLAEFITDEEVIDLTKDVANPVLTWLRLEFEPFLQSILMAQNRPFFLDLKPDAQASLFSNVLGLEKWVDYAAKASKKASTQDSISRELERKVSSLQGELSAVDRQDLSKSHDDWEVERMRRLLEVKGNYDALLEKRKKQKAKVIEAEERLAKGRKEHATVIENGSANDKEREFHRWRAEVSDYSMMLRDAERDLAKAAEELEHLGSNDVCSKCGQVLSRKDHTEQRAKARRDHEHFGKQVKRFGRELEEAQRRMTEAEEAFRDAESIIEAFRQVVDDRERDLRDARRDLEAMDRTLDDLEDRSEEIEQEANPFAGMSKDAKKRAQELRSQLRAGESALDASNERYGLFSYWTRAFKEIRLQEIGDALVELEIEVNSAVTALGLVDWELGFHIDKEGKGGSISRGFNVLVRSPHNPRATPWEAWSGGESQRLRLAGNMGLSDLIRSRSGTTLNLEVWDEPTNGLSPEGIEDLLKSLAERAAREQRQIWIVDHRAFDFGGFAGTATVIKAPSGARIRTSW